MLRPRFRFMWLASFGVATLGWIGVLLWQLQLPTSIVLPGWGSTVPMGGTPVLAANTLSWVLSFGLVSLLAASLLIAPAQPDFRNSLSWPVSLAFAGLALLAVTADNLLTVVPAWAALDVADVSLSVRWANGRDSSKGAVTVFSVRMASLALVLLALALSGAGDTVGGNNVLLIAAVASAWSCRPSWTRLAAHESMASASCMWPRLPPRWVSSHVRLAGRTRHFGCCYFCSRRGWPYIPDGSGSARRMTSMASRFCCLGSPASPWVRHFKGIRLVPLAGASH
jgi:hypothetical protein